MGLTLLVLGCEAPKTASEPGQTSDAGVEQTEYPAFGYPDAKSFFPDAGSHEAGSVLEKPPSELKADGIVLRLAPGTDGQLGDYSVGKVPFEQTGLATPAFSDTYEINGPSADEPLVIEIQLAGTPNIPVAVVIHSDGSVSIIAGEVNDGTFTGQGRFVGTVAIVSAEQLVDDERFAGSTELVIILQDAAARGVLTDEEAAALITVVLGTPAPDPVEEGPTEVTIPFEPTGSCGAGETLDESKTSCIPCPSGQWSEGVTCQPWTVCQPDQVEVVSPSAARDRQCQAECPLGQARPASDADCQPCPEGTFRGAEQVECTAWTQCAEVEVEVQGPTAVADRICGALGTCVPGEYTDSVGSVQVCVACPTGTFSEDENAASCQQWSTCGPDEYESRAPSSTTDRACGAARSCQPGQYVDTAPTANSPAVCAACPEGTFSAESDAPECLSWSACAAGEFEQAAPSPTSDRQCSPLTICKPGQFISQSASPTQDRSCADCADNSFSTTSNATSCQPWTMCGQNEVESAAPSSTSDRSCVDVNSCGPGQYVGSTNDLGLPVCVSCPASTFSNAVNSDQCIPWRACTAGEYQTQAPSSARDRVCETVTTCQPGQYVSSQATATSDATCSTCAAGAYSDSTNATSCRSWQVCGQGQRVQAKGTATSDRFCVACDDGTFASVTNAAACQNWSDCDPGEFVSNIPSAVLDRTCGGCASGRFSNQKNAAQCTLWQSCGPGTSVAQQGSATEDRTCAACDAGQYSTADNSAACLPWMTCAAGTYVAQAGTASANRRCTACAAGTYTSGANTSQCSAWQTCDPDEYQSQAPTATSDRACKTCPIGTAPPTANATTCDPYNHVAVDGSVWPLADGVVVDPGFGSTLVNGLQPPYYEIDFKLSAGKFDLPGGDLKGRSLIEPNSNAEVKLVVYYPTTTRQIQLGKFAVWDALGPNPQVVPKDPFVGIEVVVADRSYRARAGSVTLEQSNGRYRLVGQDLQGATGRDTAVVPMSLYFTMPAGRDLLYDYGKHIAQKAFVVDPKKAIQVPHNQQRERLYQFTSNGSSLWGVTSVQGLVGQIDLAKPAFLQGSAAGTSATNLDFAPDVLWVWQAYAASMSRWDPQKMARLDTVKLTGTERPVKGWTFDGQLYWAISSYESQCFTCQGLGVYDFSDSVVTWLNTTSADILFDDVVFYKDSLWLATDEGNILRLSPSSLELLDVYHVSGHETFGAPQTPEETVMNLDFVGGQLWVLDHQDRLYPLGTP